MTNKELQQLTKHRKNKKKKTHFKSLELGNDLLDFRTRFKRTHHQNKMKKHTFKIIRIWYKLAGFSHKIEENILKT